MRRCPGSQTLLTLPLNSLDLSLQRPLVHVSADAMIYFDDRGQGALPEASYSSNCKFVVRSGQQTFVAIAGVAGIVQAQTKFQANTLHQVTRPARMASGPSTNANCVVPLRLKVE